MSPFGCVPSRIRKGVEAEGSASYRWPPLDTCLLLLEPQGDLLAPRRPFITQGLLVRTITGPLCCSSINKSQNRPSWVRARRRWAFNLIRHPFTTSIRAVAYPKTPSSATRPHQPSSSPVTRNLESLVPPPPLPLTVLNTNPPPHPYLPNKNSSPNTPLPIAVIHRYPVLDLYLATRACGSQGCYAISPDLQDELRGLDDNKGSGRAGAI